MGQKFTWVNNRTEEGFVMEKLDIAFASIDWIHAYPHYGLKNQPILHSDHGPILLDFDVTLPFRNRPFRFEQMWLTHPSCKEVVRGAWNSNFDGSMAFQLCNKNAKLRSDLIKWNRDVFGRVEKEIFQKQEELMHIHNSI
ncbi:uncharacterized protein LOC142631123 [Castanea sativa]|uniref:uncharacterized protein LOC142631123 n=1 Tax=Castanea sativa TaxID=21020 RepID=UPI003F64F7AE